ncbi:MAG: EamA/RhaT family transporter [Thermoplasmata archaeon]|nr:MAG: EamA/RhaT family transporter [Thermoplasmata archaeon]
MKNKYIGNTEDSNLFFFFIMGFSIVCWGFAFPLIKLGLRELSPISLTILRLSLVSIVFLVLFLVISPSKLRLQDIPYIFLLGFIGIVLYHLCLNYGETQVSAGAASLIIATIPIFVVIFAALFLHEKITSHILLGILLSMSGVTILSITGKKLEIEYLSGAIAILFSAMVGAGYTILGKKLLQRYTAFSLTGYAFILGSVTLLPMINNDFITEVINLSTIGWIAVLSLVFFPTVIAYVFWYKALEMKPASEISVYLYFTPVISTILGIIMFNEPITPFYLLGGFLVILGLILVNTKN